MYNTGNAGFLAAACNPNRIIDTTVYLNFSDTIAGLNPNDIVSYKVTYASTGGKTFTSGSFVASQFELSLNASSDTVNSIDFKTEVINKIELLAGIKVSKTMVDIPMGEFYPDKDGVTVGDDGYVTITAIDTPPILKEQFNSSTLSLPCTVGEAINAISGQLGIPIALKALFPNTAVELTETFALTTTYREALMYIAEVLGAYVCMGRSGEILFKRCFSGLVDIGCVLDENYLFSVNKQESSVKPFQYISIKANADDLGVTQEVENVATECKYDIIDNPLTYGHPEDFLKGLVKPTAFTEFYPAVISFHGRPDLDTGDVLEYVYKGVTYILPICNHVFEYNGGFKTTVESIGTDVKQVSSVDSGVKTQITSLRQNINTLFRDLNKTQSQITDINGDLVKMSTLLQTVELLKTQVSKVEGDLEKVSTLTQTADQLKIDIKTVIDSLNTTNDTVANNQNTLLSYFDFQKDGLTIGVSSSNIKLRLANNKIQFLKDGTTEVAYFTEGQLYVTDAHFLKSLVLGNFEFTPRSNGNLSLRRRG